MGDLEGLLVVSLEQAVAAPYTSNLLAQAGARVIKVERPEGDFAREYDHVVRGQSAYFVWLNRGKESVCLDVKDEGDRDLLRRMLGRADVFIQNLKPGAVARLGLDYAALSAANPALVMCSISGYGEDGEYADMKAYDLLVQAEAGLCAITGTEEGPSRVGVSICDIATGLAGYSAILRALLARGRTGRGRHIELSLFGVMTEWMNVPLLHRAYGGASPPRMGIRHPSIAPYGAFDTADGRQLVISIQNEREWRLLCEQVLEGAIRYDDPRFASNVLRVANRAVLDAQVNRLFRARTQGDLARRLREAGIAFGRLNALEDVLAHPQLRQLAVDSPGGPFSLVRHGACFDGEGETALPVPALGAHTAAVRAEFAPG